MCYSPSIHNWRKDIKLTNLRTCLNFLTSLSCSKLFILVLYCFEDDLLILYCVDAFLITHSFDIGCLHVMSRFLFYVTTSL